MILSTITRGASRVGASAAAWEGRFGGGCQCCRWQCRRPGWSRSGVRLGLCFAQQPLWAPCVIRMDGSATTRVALRKSIADVPEAQRSATYYKVTQRTSRTLWMEQRGEFLDGVFEGV